MTDFQVKSGKNAALWKKWREEDKDFVRWLQKFDSHATQRNYWQRIVELYEGTKLTPKEIVARYKAGGETRQALLDDLDAFLNKTKKAGKVGTARMIWAAVVSLLIHRQALTVQRQFELKQPAVEMIAPQYIPTEQEFQTMLRFALCARDRYLAAQLRYAGGRRGVVDDPEPMRLANIFDLDFAALKTGEIKFRHETSCALLFYGTVKPTGEIIRNPETYVSFLPPQGMTLLKDYLEERKRKSERLTPESYLFTPERHDAKVNGRAAYLKGDQASRIISDMSKAAGFVVENEKTGGMKGKYSAHSLRRLFYNSLHGIDDVDKEALDGHIKGVRARYHGSVDEIKKAVEFMRERYETAMRDLLPQAAEDERIKNDTIRNLRIMGIPEEKINELLDQANKKFGHPSSIQFLEVVQNYLDAQKPKRTKPSMTNGGKAYDALLVDEDDLVQYLEMGWEVVKELSNGKVALRRPAH
jgi:integrase